MKPHLTATAFVLALLAFPALADSVAVSEQDFKCMLDMTPVRGFYVDNLVEGRLEATLAVANAEQGVYPPGSVVQLVPGEAMVKLDEGVSPATGDWEFFELDTSAGGTTIRKRGFADVVNRFGGNCLACHAKARPEFDFICEQGHGCDPIPVTPEMAALLQKTDPRCGGRYKPTPEEVEVLKALQARMGG